MNRDLIGILSIFVLLVLASTVCGWVANSGAWVVDSVAEMDVGRSQTRTEIARQSGMTERTWIEQVFKTEREKIRQGGMNHRAEIDADVTLQTSLTNRAFDIADMMIPLLFAVLCLIPLCLLVVAGRR